LAAAYAAGPIFDWATTTAATLLQQPLKGNPFGSSRSQSHIAAQTVSYRRAVAAEQPLVGYKVLQLTPGLE